MRDMEQPLGDRAHGLGRSLEQQAVDHHTVESRTQSDGSDPLRSRIGYVREPLEANRDFGSNSGHSAPRKGFSGQTTTGAIET